MTIPELDWYPLNVLADELKITIEKLDTYLVTAQLRASVICTGTTLLTEVCLEGYGEMEWVVTPCSEPEYANKGIYDIISYDQIRWELNTTNNKQTANLLNFDVFLFKDGKYYSPANNYIIFKSDLLVTSINYRLFTSSNGNKNRELQQQDIDSEDSLHDAQIVNIENNPQKSISIPAEKVKTRFIPNNKNKKGEFQKLILAALQDYVNTYGYMPKEGDAFSSFLYFLCSRYKSRKLRPEYLSIVVEIRNVSDKKDSCICIKVKSGDAWRKRGYFENEFNKFKKKFNPEESFSTTNIS